MQSIVLSDAMGEALRTLVVAGAPVLFASVGAGLVVGVLQSATTVREPVLGYAARLAAIGAVLYVMLPGFISSVVEFTTLLWK